MGQLNYTTAEINKTIAYRNTPPAYDVVDGVYITGNTRAIIADTEYKLEFTGALAREFSNGFNSNSGISKMWDFTDNVTSLTEFLDTPTIVALPNCYFKPSSTAEGECIIRMYVNETSPIQMDQAIVSFKGTDYEKMGDLFSFYLGEETEYDVKNKGVYFTFEFSLSGTMIDQGMFIYLT